MLSSLRRCRFPDLFRSSNYLNILRESPTMSRTYLYPREVWINSSCQRVDKELQTIRTSREHNGLRDLVTHMDWCKDNNYKQLCNDHYLKGTCDPRRCPNDDRHPLSEFQVVELAKIIQKVPCPVGSECRDSGCYYGHICLHQAYGRFCRFGNDCHLVEFHNVVPSPSAICRTSHGVVQPPRLATEVSVDTVPGPLKEESRSQLSRPE